MVEYKAVLFDLFGTLTNGRARPEDRILAHFNIPRETSGSYSKHVEQIVCATKHKTIDEYNGLVLKRLNIPNNEKNIRELDLLLQKDIACEVLVPGVEELLSALKQRKFRLAVISDLPNANYDLLAKNNLRHYFNTFTYSYETGMIKPNHEVFNSTLRSLGVSPSQAVMVGNSLKSDITPAVELGINAVHLDFKGDSKHKPRINNLSELLGLI